ncbi:unnamed protein product [Rhizophagus irregularis]|nr:unnamed protein product [Rhizophagus irregularis]
MGGKYICQHYSNEGKVCGRGSRRPEGCSIHWKRHQRYPCKQDGCERRTKSKYGFCDWHVNKCQSKERYHQKKLDKMLQDGQTPEALEEALDKMLQQVKLSLESCP